MSVCWTSSGSAHTCAECFGALHPKNSKGRSRAARNYSSNDSHAQSPRSGDLVSPGLKGCWCSCKVQHLVKTRWEVEQHHCCVLRRTIRKLSNEVFLFVFFPYKNCKESLRLNRGCVTKNVLNNVCVCPPGMCFKL